MFGVGDGLELRVCSQIARLYGGLFYYIQIKKRGAVPLGGGEVEFLCPNMKSLKILNFVEGGKVKRIRGIA